MSVQRRDVFFIRVAEQLDALGDATGFGFALQALALALRQRAREDQAHVFGDSAFGVRAHEQRRFFLTSPAPKYSR